MFSLRTLTLTAVLATSATLLSAPAYPAGQETAPVTPTEAEPVMPIEMGTAISAAANAVDSLHRQLSSLTMANLTTDTRMALLMDSKRSVMDIAALFKALERVRNDGADLTMATDMETVCASGDREAIGEMSGSDDQAAHDAMVTCLQTMDLKRIRQGLAASLAVILMAEAADATEKVRTLVSIRDQSAAETAPAAK